MKKVLLVSRPIDINVNEGSTNLVLEILKNNINQEITYLTYKLENFHSDNKSLKIYSSKLPFILNKFFLIKIFSYIKQYDVIHFFFTPSLINLIFIYFCKFFSNATFIHSIPTANKFSLKSKILKGCLYVIYI